MRVALITFRDGYVEQYNDVIELEYTPIEDTALLSFRYQAEDELHSFCVFHFEIAKAEFTEVRV